MPVPGIAALQNSMYTSWSIAVAESSALENAPVLKTSVPASLFPIKAAVLPSRLLLSQCLRHGTLPGWGWMGAVLGARCAARTGWIPVHPELALGSGWAGVRPHWSHILKASPPRTGSEEARGLRYKGLRFRHIHPRHTHRHLQ